MNHHFTQKYTIVQFLEPVSEGSEYPSSDWPLHSTVVDTFAINWSVEEITARLTEILQNHSTVKSKAGDDRCLGEDKRVWVVLLDRSASLVKLHLDVITKLEEGGLALNDPQFARDGFLPHVTIQKHTRLNKGDEVQFTALSIIDMFPNKDPYKRKVLKTIPIGAHQRLSTQPT